MGSKSGYKDKWQDNPMSAKTVKENIASRNRYNKGSIKPEEHSHMICWPKVLRNPLNKAAIQECFVQNMNDVRRKKAQKSIFKNDILQVY